LDFGWYSTEVVMGGELGKRSTLGVPSSRKSIRRDSAGYEMHPSTPSMLAAHSRRLPPSHAQEKQSHAYHSHPHSERSAAATKNRLVLQILRGRQPLGLCRRDLLRYRDASEYV
jgi:hypothetical protein